MGPLFSVRGQMYLAKGTAEAVKPSNQVQRFQLLDRRRIDSHHVLLVDIFLLLRVFARA